MAEATNETIPLMIITTAINENVRSALTKLNFFVCSITSASGTFYVCWMHSHFGIGDTTSRREIRLSTSRTTKSAFRCDAANMCIQLRFWTMCEELESAPEHTVRSYVQSIGQYSCPHPFHDGMRHGMRTDKQLYSNSNFQFFGFANAARRFCGILWMSANVKHMFDERFCAKTHNGNGSSFTQIIIDKRKCHCQRGIWTVAASHCCHCCCRQTEETGLGPPMWRKYGVDLSLSATQMLAEIMNIFCANTSDG